MRGLTNQKGLTLLEVLAAVTIISIIIVLLYGILFNSKEQYNSQTEKNEQLSDISYALKVITKDIRKSGTLPEIKQNDEKKFIKLVMKNIFMIIQLKKLLETVLYLFNKL